MRTTDCHPRRAKFVEIAAVVENVYCIWIFDVAGERDRIGAPAFHQRCAGTQGN
jgi:hypothetical protein